MRLQVLEDSQEGVRISNVIDNSSFIMFPVGANFLTPTSKDVKIRIRSVECGCGIAFNDSEGNVAVMMFKSMHTFQALIDAMQFTLSEFLILGFP